MSMDMNMMRSMHSMGRRDSSVVGKQIPPGTWKRILRFARPYRRELLVFLFVVVVDALIGVATPVLAGKVVNEITRHGEVRVVVKIAIVIAALAVVDAVLSFAQRWYSARIGEGLIFDMRTSVFDHVQRMPLAFFTRTQTGALVSRLNNDVLGAQQAFTSTLSGLVSNVVSLVLTAAVMFSLSWQITALALVMLPVFVVPARRIGTRLQAITRESYSAQRVDEHDDDRAVQRGRRAARQAVRAPAGRGPVIPRTELREFATSASRRRCTARAFFVALTLVAALAQALVYGLGGYYALTGVARHRDGRDARAAC